MNQVKEKINLKDIDDNNTIEINEEKMNKIKKYRKIVYFLIVLILISIILYVFLVAKLGRIGYRYGDIKQVNAQFDNIKIISLTKEDTNKFKNNTFDIFSNEENKELISPKSKGTYKFCIQNITDYDINYDIMFSDTMTDKVNMKYRLKIDNIYIRGSEKEYVNLNQLNLSEVKVLKNSNNVYTLEWYWEESLDEEDTRIGSSKDDVYYTLNLSIVASQIR